MSGDTVVRARIDAATKRQASEALAAMGLSVSDAIRLLLTRVAADKAFPFAVKVPNVATRKAMAELEAGDGERFTLSSMHEKRPTNPKVCPECGHVFQGSGWDGIDAHWKAKHNKVMPYGEAWPLIKSDKYRCL